MNEPAPYGKRAAALLLEVLIEFAIPVGVAILGAVTAIFGIGLLLLLVSVPLWFVIVIINRVVIQGRDGHTWGKRIMEIRLVSAETSLPVGGWTALLRFGITLVLGSVTGGLLLLLDYLWPAFDPYKRRVVDRLLGTSVVSAPVSAWTAAEFGHTPPPDQSSVW